MSILSLQSLKVAIDGGEENGLLILHHQALVGVLVCLADEPTYGADEGHWHLEAGFGRCTTRPTTFPNLEAVLRWIAVRLGIDPGEGTVCARRYLDCADGKAGH